ncbi:oligopeptide/dipeptide ABC transporter ATP-binding protein [Prosthecomicrobium sp. N25]|uniref:oligopeptide/dipeptide ABC transporter ATP-binding protein n=1 Tax=Prosthecomicrobium sp. N25 TaxID=3129254 RepID=UPI003076FD24
MFSRLVLPYLRARHSPCEINRHRNQSLRSNALSGSLDSSPDPRHPYTRWLLSSRVDKAAPGSRLVTIPGSPPDLAALPTGCAFRERCAVAEPRCATVRPSFVRRDQARGDACLLGS